MSRASQLSVSILLAMSVPALGQVGGIEIDTKGVLRHATLTPDAARLPAPPADIARGAKTRRVSLRRLEQAVSDCLKAGKRLPPEIRFLGGLQRIDTVLLYPDAGDAVLVGPAGGWKRLPSGEAVDPRSGHPLLELDDLVVALRFACSISRGEPGDSFLGCSIDPTPAGRVSYTKFMGRKTGRLNPAGVRRLLVGMQQAMGYQDVRLFGVPPDSRFAWKLVAADYRLKRVAMGFDRLPVKGLSSYMDLLARGNLSALKRQHRFWFVAHFDDLQRSPDSLAWRFVGSGLAVRTAAVDRSADPKKQPQQPSRSARTLTTNLTRRLPELARHVPVFAELQNLVRLAVAAELIISTPLPDDTRRWQPGVLVDPERYKLQVLAVPRLVPSLAAVRQMRGRKWVFSVSGGVQIEPGQLTRPEYGTVDQKLPELHKAARPPTDAPKRWWWD